MSATQSVRVLIVSARQGIRDEIEQALGGWQGDLRLFWVSQPEFAVARALELGPHVILVDDLPGGEAVTPLVRDLASRSPAAAVLALVAEDAMEQARYAVLAGARGFVTKPLRAEELQATLHEMLAARRVAPPPVEERAEAVGRLVVFCSARGGTGRTTLATNVAICLRKQADEQVALVDADYASPAIDVALNLYSERTVADLLPRLARVDEDLVAAVLTPHVSGLQVMLAPPPTDAQGGVSLLQVQAILTLLRRMFAWVIVDLGLPLDADAYSLLGAADRIVVTALPEMVGLRNTRHLLDQLAEKGVAADKVWMVLNRATLRAGVSRRDIEERLRLHVTQAIPDDQAPVLQSINRGVPLVLSRSSGAVGRAIQQFSRRLADERTAAETEEEKKPAKGRRALRAGAASS